MHAFLASKLFDFMVAEEGYPRYICGRFSIKRYTPSSVCILLNVYKNLSSEVHIVMSTCTLQVPVTNDAS